LISSFTLSLGSRHGGLPMNPFLLLSCHCSLPFSPPHKINLEPPGIFSPRRPLPAMAPSLLEVAVWATVSGNLRLKSNPIIHRPSLRMCACVCLTSIPSLSLSELSKTMDLQRGMGINGQSMLHITAKGGCSSSAGSWSRRPGWTPTPLFAR
jgi:hypothetical protein